MTCNLIPNHLTDEQKGQIFGVVSVGCDLHSAANFVGCSLADIRRAMRHDPQFAAGVRRSQASAELSHMRTVQQAAKDAKNWRASTWWLERHAPERYGPRSAGVVTASQMKAYVSILADVLDGEENSEMDRAGTMKRLKTLAESVDQLLRTERMLVPEAFDTLHADRTESASDADSSPSNIGDSEYETSS